MFNPPDYIITQKSYTQEELEAAVLKAALEEREACAEVCDRFALTEANAETLAAAIRARGE